MLEKIKIYSQEDLIKEIIKFLNLANNSTYANNDFYCDIAIPKKIGLHFHVCSGKQLR